MVIEYDRAAAVAYARKWALGKNPNYYYFGGIGGDCTNFVSQCLLAGGGIMNFDYVNGWFYISQADRSPSWTSVAYLHEFLLRKAKSPGPFAEEMDIAKLQLGDLIQLRQNQFGFNHTLIISNIVGGQIYVCAHSDAALDRPLDDYTFNQALGLHIEGVQK